MALSDNTFNKKVAYFSMEYAIDQSLKIYSGGLGFLAGSHMRSAYDLKQNVLGVGILYSYGYYDQVRNEDGFMEAKFVRKQYSFLKDTGIIFPITVHGSEVQVKVYLLPPDTFGSAPLYLLTTDIPENDYLSRSISYRLYDSDLAARIAQFMLLGIGGGKLLDILGEEPEVYHLNEGHGLPLLFYLYSKYRDLEEVKKRVVFTTHTPEKAGNEEIALDLLEEMTFFDDVSMEEVRKLANPQGNTLNFTVTALRFAKRSNAVSKIHSGVSNAMWCGHYGTCDIVSITNAQNKKYWVDQELEAARLSGNDDALLERKKLLKRAMIEVVADQTGTLLDEDVLTVVWARRFAGYKRADLLLLDFERFRKLLTRQEKRIQVIWAGKPYPKDQGAIDLFNHLISVTRDLPGCAVLTGYELKLSSILKKGADVWLNTPRYAREASGTSGMTAAMNGTVNFSIPDGWIPEFARHGQNCFEIPVDPAADYSTQDREDNQNMMDILESEIIPTYYNNKTRWLEIMKNGMRDVAPDFDSDRMAREYYEKMYKQGVGQFHGV